MSSNKKESFQQLKAKWYLKLEKSGFKDIEKDEYTLKRPVTKVMQNKHGLSASGRWRGRFEYYYMAEHFLNAYEFESVRDKNIWMYHTNAISVRNITKIINKVIRPKIAKSTVWNIISKYEKIMRTTMWDQFADIEASEQ